MPKSRNTSRAERRAKTSPHAGKRRRGAPGDAPGMRRPGRAAARDPQAAKQPAKPRGKGNPEILRAYAEAEARRAAKQRSGRGRPAARPLGLAKPTFSLEASRAEAEARAAAAEAAELERQAQLARLEADAVAGDGAALPAADGRATEELVGRNNAFAALAEEDGAAEERAYSLQPASFDVSGGVAGEAAAVQLRPSAFGGGFSSDL